MVTLTYRPDKLPMYGSLQVEDFQKFVKRVRKSREVRRVNPSTGRLKNYSGPKFKYFHCGEYGERYGRPHYHALLFGVDFPDKVQVAERRGFPVWRSPKLEELWPSGLSEIGTVTFESAAYVARYVVKKRFGRENREHYERVALDTGEIFEIEPEYTTMSRGGRQRGPGGIGAGWMEKFHRDVYPSDEVRLIDGRKVRPPRYYDGQFEIMHPEDFESLKEARRLNRDRRDDSPERLRVLEVCAKARSAKFKRELDVCE